MDQNGSSHAPLGGGGFSALLTELRAAHRARDPFDLSWRRGQLHALDSLLKNHDRDLRDALFADLGKGGTEGYVTEIGLVRAEISTALKNMDRWARPHRASLPLALQPASARVRPEPLGVALIIGAWNYPVNLMLAPLVGCMAAGNGAVLKPSELAPATSATLARLIPQYMDPGAVRVVEGGVDTVQSLQNERFDKIFFTGGRHAGALVMAAAARHVTPVTLELGGKSPCIVNNDADIALAARRIVFGKFTNAGQTCVAPDYVLAHRDIAGPLTDAFRAAIHKFYGVDPAQSPDYGRIVNDRHHARLVGLLAGQDILHGGQHDASARYIAPTLLRDPAPDSPVMRDEIFGPILPILAVADMDAAFRFVAERDKPLALYAFTRDGAVQRCAEKMPAGAACINDTIVHTGAPDLPFGGVGGSGFGKYHGRAGFDDFSNLKPVFKGAGAVDPPVRYPPYGPWKDRILRFLMR